MIELDLLFNNEIVKVRVTGDNLLFGKASNQGYFATIDKLQLSHSGVLKEFPDLEDKDNWREIAIERFKEKVKLMPTEAERAKYVVNDLVKFGYKPLRMTRQGSRTRSIKDGNIKNI